MQQKTPVVVHDAEIENEAAYPSYLILVQGINPIHASEDFQHLVAESHVVAWYTTEQFDLFILELKSILPLDSVAVLPGEISILPEF